MKIEMLTKFCGTGYPKWIQEPWNQKGYTYATDGHVIIKIPALPGVVKRWIDVVEELPWSTLAKRSTFRVRPGYFLTVRDNFLCEACLPDAPAAVPCRQCRNTDDDRANCLLCGGVGLEKIRVQKWWNTKECPECDGTRWAEKIVWCLRRDEKDFAKNYFVNPQILHKLIWNLGLIEFTAPPDTGPVGFRFAAGDGLLMPMRPAPWHVMANMSVPEGTGGAAPQGL